MVKDGETDFRIQAKAREPSGEQAATKVGRPCKRWRIHVVRIDAAKYPQFQSDRDHPFARMAIQARVDETDSFCARLRARARKWRMNPAAAA